MNKQTEKGIGYCDYTVNPVPGCQHECQWELSGGLVECYAKTVAESIASKAYPQGFKHRYYFPERMAKCATVKKPSVIFVGSTGDLFGHWVTGDQILEVFRGIKAAPQHRFLLLTKNAPRIARLKYDFPPNVWMGVSMPPTWMNGQRMTYSQQCAYVEVALGYMAECPVPTWMSFEPLSFDVAPILREVGVPFKWCVIGAGSSRQVKHQPHIAHVDALLEVVEGRSRVWFKNNMDWEYEKQWRPSGMGEGG